MNKFLKDLEKELQKLNVNPKEIKEILADHKEMIEAAKQEGLNEDEISLKFGNPSKVASEIHEDTERTEINFDDIEDFASYKLEDYTFVKAFNDFPKDVNLSIGLVSDDFILCEYTGDSIQVLQNKVEKIEDYTIELEDKEFTLKKKTSKKLFGSITFTKQSGEFLVLLPKGLETASFNYKGVSGDISINKLSVSKFNIKSTNGDIELSNIVFGEANFSLVNGDVEMQGVKGKSLDISLINGDVEMRKGSIEGNVQFNSVSGDVELSEVECNTASFKTVSGDVEGRNFYTNELSLRSVSGDVEIDNDDKSREIRVVSKKTLSGDISINR